MFGTFIFKNAQGTKSHYVEVKYANSICCNKPRVEGHPGDNAEIGCESEVMAQHKPPYLRRLCFAIDSFWFHSKPLLDPSSLILIVGHSIYFSLGLNDNENVLRKAFLSALLWFTHSNQWQRLQKKPTL
ncbi:unnamed protein product [Ilex paraguariensis]|uniref:Uncharacterized protein n=1 Tax=Ilex paraguariensis TaxID=185542 RepID=A0ABC8RCH6_9AQUA